MHVHHEARQTTCSINQTLHFIISLLQHYTLKILTPLDAKNISSNQKVGYAAAMPEVLASVLGYFDSAVGTIAFAVNSEVPECQFARL